MIKLSLNAVLPALFVLFSCSAVCAVEDVKVSPHSDAGDCAICHVATENKLRGWFVFGSTKREMRADLDQLCLKCHPVETTHSYESLAVGKGHATGKKPSINRQNLPLASDGTITCATTCHNMHVTADDRRLQLKYLRAPFSSLCVSCHNV